MGSLEEQLKQKQVGSCLVFLLILMLRVFQKEKEDLEEVSMELELADEDEKIS